MDGSAECAPFVSRVSLHYADTFSRCGHFFGAHAVPKLSSRGINDSRAAHAVCLTNSSFCASWPACGQVKERVACPLQFWISSAPRGFWAFVPDCTSTKLARTLHSANCPSHLE